jgi:hypothetical protein
MKLVAQTSQFRVYDDVLPEKDFRAVWNHVQLESYVSVHQDGWVKVWRIPDGVPLAAAAAVLLERPKPAAGDATAGREPRHGATRIHPTQTGIDRVLATLVEHADDFADLVGQSVKHPRLPGGLERDARSTRLVHCLSPKVLFMHPNSWMRRKVAAWSIKDLLPPSADRKSRLWIFKRRGSSFGRSSVLERIPCLLVRVIKRRARYCQRGT